MSTFCNSYSGFSEVTQNKSVHYRQPHRRMNVKVYVCTNRTKVCVHNVLCVLECKL